jgi:hypothetical protein
VIDLDPATVAIRRAFVTRLTQERLGRGEGRMGDDDLLFVNENGAPVHPDRVSKMFDASLRRYNRNRPKAERLPQSGCTTCATPTRHTSSTRE